MSWRDRLAQRDRAARANAISAKSAVSPLIGPNVTNGTIGKAGPVRQLRDTAGLQSCGFGRTRTQTASRRAGS
jgi:hypothetical protein